MSLDALTQLIASTESTELAEEQNQPTVMIWPLRGGLSPTSQPEAPESTELTEQPNQPN